MVFDLAACSTRAAGPIVAIECGASPSITMFYGSTSGAFERNLPVFGPVLTVAAWLGYRMFRRIAESDFMELAASIQDDSFYYLVPAFGFREMGRFTFDGVATTYGFQPAYECVLTVFAAFFSDFGAFVRAAMGLNVLLHIATGVLVAALVARGARKERGVLALLQRLAGAATGVLFLTTGTVFLSSITCKENALAEFLLAASLTWAQLLTPASSDPHGSRRTRLIAFGFGALVAGLLLCRLLPTTVTLCCILSRLAIRHRRARVPFALGLLLPIVLWSGVALEMFGEIIPTSVRVKVAYGRVDRPALDVLKLGFKYLYHAVRFAVGQESNFHFPQRDAAQVWGSGPAMRVPVAVAAVAVSTLVARVVRDWRSRSLNASSPELVLGLCSIGVILVYPIQGMLIARQRSAALFYPSWYIFDLPVLLTAVLGLGAVGAIGAIGAIGRSRRREFKPVIVGAILASSVLAILPVSARGFRFFWNAEPYRQFERSAPDWQHTMMRSGLWLRDNVRLAPDERVACISCGALALIFPNRLVSLDGLASDEAAVYYLKPNPPSVVTLLVRHRARYYVDFEGTLADDPNVRHIFLHREPFAHGVYAVSRLSTPIPPFERPRTLGRQGGSRSNR